MTKPLGRDIPSKIEIENSIVFALVDVFCSTQPSYLQSKCDHSKSETPSQLNSQNHNRLSNQERIQKNKLLMSDRMTKSQRSHQVK